ncbi:MAG: transcriptional repressor [Hydrogenothermus sp.]|nr:MAG: transcriptional repressor [Hydrogenothermus sp.]
MKKDTIKKQFKDFIKRRGLKFTSQRESVLEEILNVKGHFEIEDMVKRIKEKDIPVSRATVYRTLNILKEMGLVNEVIKYRNKTIYEISLKQHHDHLICTKCGSIIEFSEEEIEKLQDKICKEYGFKPETHRLEIFGICKNCS